MSLRNLLFVSIAFPPKLDPECIQAARYFKYLKLLGQKYNINVVTSSIPTLFMPVDESLKKYDVPQHERIELKLFEPKFIHSLINKISPSLLQLPDSKYSFHLQWKKVVKKLDVKPNIIYSRSFPVSSAVLALKLQKYYQVPWVMHLSDPWVDSPLHRYGANAQKINLTWEKACFKYASYISFTSEKTLALYRKKYTEYAHKLIHMPNVYDSDEAKPKGFTDSNCLKFVYTGGLANTRTAETLLQAISNLKQSSPELLKNCDFVFAGDIDSHNKSLFNQYTDSTIKYLGRLSYTEALKLQRSAHVLIAIDSNITDKANALFFPSKLLDYWISGKRILAITTSGSTTDEFINKYNLGTVAYINDVNAIQTHITECIRAFKDGNNDFFKISTPIEEFEAHHNVVRLIEIFDKLV